jgi:phage terminase small subunit
VARRRLTNKQRAFIEHYLKCWNAAESARRAGYSERTARFIGSENLTKPNIRAEIDKRLEELAMSAAEVLARLTDQATASMADFISLDDETGYPRLDLKQAFERGKLHLLKKMRVTDQGHLTIELHDGQKALMLLGQHHKLFTQKHEVEMPQLEPLSEALRKMVDKVYGEGGD